MSINTIAGTAGRITGTAARGLIWAHRTIDWAEVGAIVLEGLQVLIVLTLLAGRATRRAWDALVPTSEALGRSYSRWLVPATEAAQAAAPAAPAIHPLAVLATELEQLTRTELQALACTRRRLAKAQLISLTLAC